MHGNYGWPIFVLLTNVCVLFVNKPSHVQSNVLKIVNKYFPTYTNHFIFYLYVSTRFFHVFWECGFRSTWKVGTWHFSFILIVCHSFVTFLWRKCNYTLVESRKQCLNWLLYIIQWDFPPTTSPTNPITHDTQNTKTTDQCTSRSGLEQAHIRMYDVAGLNRLARAQSSPLISGCPKVNNKKPAHIPFYSKYRYSLLCCALFKICMQE